MTVGKSAKSKRWRDYLVYFGTSMGEVFYSADGGDSWSQLPGQFPRITSIKTLVREG